MTTIQAKLESLSEVAAATGTPTARARVAFIDNIRWTMIVLVLTMHACDTYSPFGNWYFTDRKPITFATALSFAVYQAFLQAFFMGLLFFISGYFAAPSFDRKGFAGFLRERFIRLGIPTLLYMLAIGPLTQYFLSRTWGGGGFVRQWLTHLADGEWLAETGPMWFCAALLAFSLVYALIRAFGFAIGRPSVLSDRALASFVVIAALATFVVRVFLPENVSILNMHFGDFPQYVIMFAAGILARRGAWLDRLVPGFARRWSVLPLLCSALVFVALVIFGGALDGQTAAYNGGFNWVSAGKALWESLVVVGMSVGLIALYGRYFNRQGAFAKFLSDNAFAVYLFHPPVLIASAFLLRGLEAPAIVKVVILTLAAGTATFLLCAFVFRRIPLLREIL